MPGKAHVPRRLRERVAKAAGYRCGYWRTPESIVGFRLSIEHIIPEAKGGKTVEDNLWIACHACNEFKAARTQGRDPATGKRVRLWNPRRQKWVEHFAWSKDGTEIAGLTPCGRATIATLQLNRPELVAARSLWVQVGWWPPRGESPGWWLNVEEEQSQHDRAATGRPDDSPPPGSDAGRLSAQRFFC
jgi:HNH endonuclease